MPRQLDVFTQCAARLLLKCMQDENCLASFGDINDPPFASGMNTDFVHASPDGSHRLEIGRHETSLNGIQLESGRAPDPWRKCFQIVQAAPDKT